MKAIMRSRNHDCQKCPIVEFQSKLQWCNVTQLAFPTVVKPLKNQSSEIKTKLLVRISPHLDI